MIAILRSDMGTAGALGGPAAREDRAREPPNLGRLISRQGGFPQVREGAPARGRGPAGPAMALFANEFARNGDRDLVPDHRQIGLDAEIGALELPEGREARNIAALLRRALAGLVELD